MVEVNLYMTCARHIELVETAGVEPASKTHKEQYLRA